MLIDKLRIDFKAGKGGDGAVSFGHDRKPSGGDGGHGASIYLEGSNSVHDLTPFTQYDEIVAPDAMPGGKEGKTGKSGEDVVLKVPLTTIVYTTEGEKLHEITEPGQRVLVVKGGRGGLGNFNFRKGQAATLYKHTPGKVGAKLKSFLELRLSADIIFIGLPNAGKSSLLNAFTNSKVKVANYPFTTLQPHLGVADTMVLMDLPGLIEGAASGKGLGKKFLRHTTAAHVVAHVVSLESEDPVADYELIRAELDRLSTDLAEKPEVIILNKADVMEMGEAEKIAKKFKKYGRRVLICSSFLMPMVKDTKKALQQELEKLGE